MSLSKSLWTCHWDFEVQDFPSSLVSSKKAQILCKISVVPTPDFEYLQKISEYRFKM